MTDRAAPEKDELFGQLEHAVDGRLRATGIFRIDDQTLADPSIAAQRRRGLRSAREPLVGYLALVADDEGVLDWRLESSAPSPPASARRAARRPLSGGRVILERKCEPVQGSKVGAFLDRIDGQLNTFRGLHVLDGASPGIGLRTVAPVTGKDQRILLFIHGTFSECRAMYEALDQSSEGRALLHRARRHYDQVLAFEHPTLSVSPVLNAIDLARAFSGSRAAIDVVCHSRGGLVARWWLEVIDPTAAPRARVILVGAPLLGTSLASPTRLRAGLKLLTNVAGTLQAAGGMAAVTVPLFGAVTALIRLFGSLTGAFAGTPVVDAAVAMIPGLAAQSRIGPAGEQELRGNFELERLARGQPSAVPTYFAVKGNFEPTDAAWGFLKYFVQTKLAIAGTAADLVFSAENDLVVDTASMDQLAPGVPMDTARVLPYDRSQTVHHLNYLAQPETAVFIGDKFGVP